MAVWAEQVHSVSIFLPASNPPPWTWPPLFQETLCDVLSCTTGSSVRGMSARHLVSSVSVGLPFTRAGEPQT